MRKLVLLGAALALAASASAAQSPMSAALSAYEQAVSSQAAGGSAPAQRKRVFRSLSEAEEQGAPLLKVGRARKSGYTLVYPVELKVTSAALHSAGWFILPDAVKVSFTATLLHGQVFRSYQLTVPIGGYNQTVIYGYTSLPNGKKVRFEFARVRWHSRWTSDKYNSLVLTAEVMPASQASAGTLISTKILGGADESDLTLSLVGYPPTRGRRALQANFATTFEPL